MKKAGSLMPCLGRRRVTPRVAIKGGKRIGKRTEDLEKQLREPGLQAVSVEGA